MSSRFAGQLSSPHVPQELARTSEYLTHFFSEPSLPNGSAGSAVCRNENSVKVKDFIPLQKDLQDYLAALLTSLLYPLFTWLWLLLILRGSRPPDLVKSPTCRLAIGLNAWDEFQRNSLTLGLVLTKGQQHLPPMIKLVVLKIACGYFQILICNSLFGCSCLWSLGCQATKVWQLIHKNIDLKTLILKFKLSDYNVFCLI